MRETVAGAQHGVGERRRRIRCVRRCKVGRAERATCRTSSCSRRTTATWRTSTKFVAANPDVRDMVEARDNGHVLDFDNLDAANLLKACTALEVVTENAAGRRRQPAEVHLAAQRRPALLVPALGRPAAGRRGRSATGRRRQDPETGEIISAAAYIYGAALDIYAKFAADSVRLANGQLGTDDLLSGKTISDVLAESAARQQGAREPSTMSDAAKSLIQARLKALGPTRDDRLREGRAPGIDDQPLRLIKGTDGGEAAAQRRRAAGDHPGLPAGRRGARRRVRPGDEEALAVVAGARGAPRRGSRRWRSTAASTWRSSPTTRSWGRRWSSTS